MNDLKIFFNTRIENAGFMSAIGNAGLYPLQYLKDGDTVTIENESGYKITMNPIFDNRGDSLCMKMMKTLVAVALLVPGLILSLFKLAAYISSDVREKHALVKEYITESGRFVPITRSIGNRDNPIKTIDELEKALNAEWLKYPANLTGALVIFGDGNLKIKEDPGILRFDPKKLILVGAKLVHGVSEKGCLDEKLYNTGKWKISAGRVCEAQIDPEGRTVSLKNADGSFAQPQRVRTLGEAFQALPDKMHNGRPYRMIYTLPLPQATSSFHNSGDSVSNSKRISLEDVTKITVKSPCAQSYPCQHNCVVSLNDNREATDLNSFDIWAIVSTIAPEKIASSKNWNAHNIKAHFSQYKTAKPGLGWQIKSAEDTLNSLLFYNPN